MHVQGRSASGARRVAPAAPPPEQGNAEVWAAALASRFESPDPAEREAAMRAAVRDVRGRSGPPSGPTRCFARWRRPSGTDPSERVPRRTSRSPSS